LDENGNSTRKVSQGIYKTQQCQSAVAYQSQELRHTYIHIYPTAHRSIEIPPDLPKQMLAIKDGLKQRLATSPLHTLPQRPNNGVEVRLEEEGDADAQVRAAMDDAVVCRLPLSVCPALHHVAYVYDESAGDGVRG